MTAAPGRVLLLLHEPEYFRLYGSTIVELSRHVGAGLAPAALASGRRRS